MKQKIIVTSGKKYIDIDAYASCYLYAKLLRKKGINAKAITNAKLNESIPEKIFKTDLMEKYEKEKNEKYIILDVSNKEFFDTFVDEENIIQIIDHHPGNDNYWKEKLKQNAIIEEIGAVATKIFEIYEEENMINEITKEDANLLIAAILDNTLNLKAKITNNRDIKAYKKLLKITKDKKFRQKYFIECQNKIEKNLEQYLIEGTKYEKINEKLPKAFSQLLVWNKDDIIKKEEIILKELKKIDKEWMLNLISLKDGKSYIITDNEKYKEKLEKLFNKKFNNNIMNLKELWLRKEIIKKSI